MQNARTQLDRLFRGEAAPAPAPTKPDVRPSTPAPRPTSPPPSTPDPDTEDPWRKKEIKPGSEPGPKARRARAEALALLKASGLEDLL